MRRSKQAAEYTKMQLIEAACRVFYKEGVAKATLEQIAREAGVTRGALYWHFHNKADILDALFQTVMPQLHELDERLHLQQGACYWQQLADYYESFFQRLEQNLLLRQFCTVVHLKCEMTENNTAVVALLSGYRQMWEAQIYAIVKKAIVIGALPQNTDVAATVDVMRIHLVGLMVTYLTDCEQQQTNKPAVLPIQPLHYVFSMLQKMPLLKAS